MWEYNYTPGPDELYHYGVPGMKWGRRKARPVTTVSTSRSQKKQLKSEYKAQKKAERSTPEAKAKRAARAKTAAKIGAAAAATAIAAYGGYKLSGYLKTKAGKLSYESGVRYANENFFNKSDWSKQPTNEYLHLMDAGRKTLQNTDKRTKKVSSSTKAAIKYLRNPNSMLVDGELLDWY